MIEEKALINLCQQEGLEIFKVETVLDEDVDIILDVSDITELFRLCKCSGEKCIFYSYILEEEDLYRLDVDSIRKSIMGFLDEGIYGCGLGTSNTNLDQNDIDMLLNKYEFKIQEIVKQQNDKIKKCEWNAPLFLDVFIVYNGERVGVSFEAENKISFEKFKSDNDIVNDVIQGLNTDIKNIFEEKNRKKAIQHERELEAYTKKCNEVRKKIEEELKFSGKLLMCTNQKLRHAYARKLAQQYSSEYAVQIAIGDVDILVEEAYRNRK